MARCRVSVSNCNLYHGDCLDVLSSLREKHVSFDLVYVDPPFNAGGARAARLDAGQRSSGPEAYRDAWGGLTSFLRMLEPRLVAIKDVMSARASLWLHLDHRTVHDAKVLADRVFGAQAFRGEVIWVPGNGGRRRNGPSVTHQTILIFSTDKAMIYNADHPALREPYAETSRRMHFTQLDEDGRRFRERRINGKQYRYYEDAGRRLGSVWADCPAMRANTPLISETTGYPTQKPESLLERIILAASVEDSTILDPMCGSGTTLAVAARLGRRCVGIDLSKIAYQITRQRLGSAALVPARRTDRVPQDSSGYPS